ncbi:HNH endonuclease signature motif containing protein [Pseudomonas syringae]|uniref:HNH endonuclease n=1 Tax=Pseudomonas syringae TaxID=317 RepID=UPI0034D95447
MGRDSDAKGWCFLPWKGISNAYRWGYKARTELSDYFSALIGIQAAFLANESERFEITRNGERVIQCQPRARWRDGSSPPSLLGPKQGWIKIHIDELETITEREVRARLLHPAAEDLSPISSKAKFSERAARVRDFQTQFSMDVSALWNGRCAITGSSLALEAAHLKCVADCDPSDPALTDPYNGILLTASLHRLMDADIFGFDLHGSVVVDPEVNEAEKRIHNLNGQSTVRFHKNAVKYLHYRSKRHSDCRL